MSVESKSWADAENDLPASQIIENSDGTKTIISYKFNEQGKKIKHTQKIKLVKVTETVDPAVAARRKWHRYGEEKDNKTVGPDARTTQFGEEVKLILGVSWAQEAKQEAEEKKLNVKTKSQTVKCRTCQGEHFTSKCPYKDTLGSENAGEAGSAALSSAVPTDIGASSGEAQGYIPPHMRNKMGGMASLAERRERDDSTTLKVTNLNTSADEGSLDQVFSNFGMVNRITIVRNRETRESRGIAFVEMDSIRSAEKAMEKLNGRGFMNMILSVEWSKPKVATR